MSCTYDELIQLGLNLSTHLKLNDHAQPSQRLCGRLLGSPAEHGQDIGVDDLLSQEP